MKKVKELYVRRANKIGLRRVRRKKEISIRKKNGWLFSLNIINNISIIKPSIKAPVKFSLTVEPVKTLFFFNQLRIKSNYTNIKGKLSIRINLSKVKEIDFASISILKSIMEEAKFYGIMFSGDLPKDQDCKKLLIDYGFFKSLVDENEKEINIKSRGEHFSFEKKSGRVTTKDLKYFDDLSNITYNHIKGTTGPDGYIEDLIIMLKEISGNAVEWSNSHNEQWLLGVLKEEDKVIFTITDLGKGILETLYVSNKLKFIDVFLFKNKIDMLEKAFDRRYGSVSQEINRNRGLPSIKNAFIQNHIKKLIVCTNDVILHFEDYGKSVSLKENLYFQGTFYQWEINKECNI